MSESNGRRNQANVAFQIKQQQGPKTFILGERYRNWLFGFNENSSFCLRRKIFSFFYRIHDLRNERSQFRSNGMDNLHIRWRCGNVGLNFIYDFCMHSMRFFLLESYLIPSRPQYWRHIMESFAVHVPDFEIKWSFCPFLSFSYIRSKIYE